MEEDALANAAQQAAAQPAAQEATQQVAQSAATPAADAVHQAAPAAGGESLAQGLGNEIEQIGQHTEYAIQFLIDNGAKIFSAVIILAIGYYLSGWLKGFLLKRFEARNLDPTLAKFFAGSARIMILMLVTVFAVAKFYDIAPLVAGIGALAFGASLAIQGPISNFGSGIAIILTRPFVVEDTIFVKGQFGQVKEVTLGYTQLETEDKEIITIPNKLIMGEIFTNSKGNRIVEQTVNIPASADAQAACKALREAIESIEGVVMEPTPMIGIENFGAGYIVLAYRYWIPTSRYHRIRFEVNKAIDTAFRAAGIPPAFPHYDVSMTKEG